MKIRILLIALCISWVIGCAQKRVSPARHRKLIEAISKHGLVYYRAIEELGQIAGRDQAVQELLMQELFSETIEADDIGSFQLAKAFGRADASVTEKLIREYGSYAPDEQQLEKLLVVLGRMGPKAKDAVPFLLEQLDKYRTDPEVEGWIRVVLANVGYEYDENFATILSDIKNRSDRAKAEIYMMAVAGPREWGSDLLVKEMNGWLYDELRAGATGSDEALFLALILGALGKVDRATAEVIGVLFELRCVEEECEEPDCIWLGFVLAKVDAISGQLTLRAALKCLTFALGAGDVLTVDILIGPDRNMMKKLVRMLDDTEPKVVNGALATLSVIGLDAQPHAPKILKILRESPYWRLRLSAARALGYMADPAEIPTLEAILQKEPDEFVREELAETIRIMRLEEKKED